MLDVITILGVNAAIQHNNKKLYLFDKEILVVALDGTCTFDDGSEMMLEPEHLQDLKLQVQGRAPTFHAPKPVTPRNTQFAGFAKAVVDELDEHHLTPVHPEAKPIFKTMIAEIIAQRAYDLVGHAVCSIDLADFECQTNPLEFIIKTMPDLTELPEVSQ